MRFQNRSNKVVTELRVVPVWSYKWGKAYATMSKVIMGHGGFYGCLGEPQGVSAQWKETAQTCIRFLSYFFVKKYLLVGASGMLWTG